MKTTIRLYHWNDIYINRQRHHRSGLINTKHFSKYFVKVHVWDKIISTCSHFTPSIE